MTGDLTWPEFAAIVQAIREAGIKATYYDPSYGVIVFGSANNANVGKGFSVPLPFGSRRF